MTRLSKREPMKILIMLGYEDKLRSPEDAYP